MPMNAELSIQPTHVASPSRHCHLDKSSHSKLLSTPRARQTPTKSSTRKKRALPRMSPSPRVGRTPVSRAKPESSRFSDRFIPSRRSMNVDMCRRSLFSNEQSEEEARDDAPFLEQRKCFKKCMLSALCDYPIESLDDNAKPKSLFRVSKPDDSRQCGPKTLVRLEDPYSHNIFGGYAALSRRKNEIAGRQTSFRKVVETKPFRVLDAPNLVDDYYMDHLDWNDKNVLAIGLDDMVYLYDFISGNVTELMKMNHGRVASVSWCTTSSNYLAIGSTCGAQIWDAESRQKLRILDGHIEMVPSLSWNQHFLTTGGRDSRILNHDLRCRCSVVVECRAHESMIVKLKWNEDGSMLASGGNDDLVCIWDIRMSSERRSLPGGRISVVEPRLKFLEHESAVKAIDWNPHERGLLATAGGSSDKKIKIWNAQNGTVRSSTCTGSQVTSIFWSPHRNELCTSHGYLGNVLTLWNHGQQSKLTKMADFTSHTCRILSTAISPDGSKIVSASPDETIRFWDVFGEPVKKRSSSSISSVWGEVSLGGHRIR